jgi:diaminopimelate decarboxylase
LKQTSKRTPFADELLIALAREHGTPLYVYDAASIRARVRELRSRFDLVRYAQKANANLALLALIRAEGCAVDAVSAGEVERALAAGFRPDEIVFTSDLFDRAGLACVARPGLAVNLGSADMIEQYAALALPGQRREITLRVNPGFGAGHAAAVTTGGEASKHGIWHAELGAAVARARAAGLVVTGLHVHVGSGAAVEGLVAAARAVRELGPLAGDALATLSAGGGIPIPYRTGEPRADLDALAAAWRATQRALEHDLGHPLALECAPGRYLVAEAGVLLTEVRATKTSGTHAFVLVDAGFNALPRPLLYGSYHEIHVLGVPADAPRRPQLVAGPLCESADVFTRERDGRLAPRLLPAVRPGDLLCIHDAGAYAASMASTYNAQPLAAEVLVDGAEARRVRRRIGSLELER